MQGWGIIPPIVANTYESSEMFKSKSLTNLIPSN